MDTYPEKIANYERPWKGTQKNTTRPSGYEMQNPKEKN